MPSLVVEATGQKIGIDQAMVTIGSGDKSTIQIGDAKVSAIHCQLIKTQKGYKLVALESQHGTFINGIKIGEQMLKKGDIVQLGVTTFVWNDDANGAPTTPTKPATAKLAAPKPPTQAIRPPTQAVRTPTEPVKPPPTTMPPPTRPTSRPAMRLKPMAKRPVRKPGADEPKRTGIKKNMKLLIPIGIASVLALGGIIWFMTRPSEEDMTKEYEKKITGYQQEIVGLEKENKIEESIGKIHELVALIEKAPDAAKKKWGHLVSEEKAHEEELQGVKKGMMATRKKVQAFLEEWGRQKDSSDVASLQRLYQENDWVLKDKTDLAADGKKALVELKSKIDALVPK